MRSMCANLTSEKVSQGLPGVGQGVLAGRISVQLSNRNQVEQLCMNHGSPIGGSTNGVRVLLDWRHLILARKSAIIIRPLACRKITTQKVFAINLKLYPVLAVLRKVLAIRIKLVKLL